MSLKEDSYIRKIVRESALIPEADKNKILDRFHSKQLVFNQERKRYCCPSCNLPISKKSNYCSWCGQKVTLERPVYVVLD